MQRRVPKVVTLLNDLPTQTVRSRIPRSLGPGLGLGFVLVHNISRYRYTMANSLRSGIINSEPAPLQPDASADAGLSTWY